MPISLEGDYIYMRISHIHETWLLELLGSGDIFVRDRASTATVDLLRCVINKMNIEVTVGPPYSPSLHPINLLGTDERKNLHTPS